MMTLLDPKLGLLRGIYGSDKDDKVIGITVGELRAAHAQLVEYNRLLTVVKNEIKN